MRLYSVLTRKVKKTFRTLPTSVQQRYVEKCKLIRAESIYHPSLKWEKVRGKRKGSENYYRVSVSRDYRAICIFNEEISVLRWYWIGPHHEYDRVIEKLK